MKFQDRHRVIPAAYVVLRDNDKVLLLRRANTGYHDGEYSLPAGHVDGAEAADTAARREAKEEIGLDIAPDSLSLVHTMHRISSQPELHERIDLYFTVSNWAGEPINAEPHKCDDLSWFPISDLPENMVTEVKLALEHITKNEPYSSLGF